MTSELPAPAARCAVHPGRPAVDRCPRCGRARCGVDVAYFGTAGCPADRVASRRAASGLEQLTRAALAGLGVVLGAGPVVSQYLDAGAFGLILPAVAGLVAGTVIVAAAGRGGAAVTTVAVLAALLAVALAVRVLPGGGDPAASPGKVLPAYAVAAAAALLAARPPRR